MIQNNYFYISKSEFWHYFLQHPDCRQLLVKDAGADRKYLFRQFVAVVNFETSTYCNRKCLYCPVSVQGARQQRLMADDVFEKTIHELQNIEYRGIISISLYNEPLADKSILRRIEGVRKALPWCYIRMNSNGDYMNREYLDQIIEAGGKEILITLHMNQGESYTDAASENKIKDFFARLQMDYTISHKKEGHNITVDRNYHGLRLLVVTNNWQTDGNDRGGIVKTLSTEARTAPCASPFREVVMDIDGNFRRCCNMYVSSPAMANIMQTSMLDFFFSDEMYQIRRELLGFGEKAAPCKTCNTFDYAMNIGEKEWGGYLKTANMEKESE